jgi:hypothetical protein
MFENTFAQILSQVSTFAESANDLASLQNFIVKIIPQRLPNYNWTGFYMLDPGDPETLVLGIPRKVRGHCGRLYGADSSRVFRRKIEPVVFSAPWVEAGPALRARVAAAHVFADRQFVSTCSTENCPNIPL